MKKSSLRTIVSYLNGETVTNLDEIKNEILTELAKGEAKAEANRALYADIHDAVMEVLANANTPVTANEIAVETGIARGKIAYGIRHYWQDEVVIDNSGNALKYSLS